MTLNSHMRTKYITYECPNCFDTKDLHFPNYQLEIKVKSDVICKKCNIKMNLKKEIIERRIITK